MKKKDELLKESIQIFKTEKVHKWYAETLEPTPMYETINLLEIGIYSGKITAREALTIALLIGIHWNEKPEGCPEL